MLTISMSFLQPTSKQTTSVFFHILSAMSNVSLQQHQTLQECAETDFFNSFDYTGNLEYLQAIKMLSAVSTHISCYIEHAKNLQTSSKFTIQVFPQAAPDGADIHTPGEFAMDSQDAMDVDIEDVEMEIALVDAGGWDLQPELQGPFPMDIDLEWDSMCCCSPMPPYPFCPHRCLSTQDAHARHHPHAHPDPYLRRHRDAHPSPHPDPDPDPRPRPDPDPDPDPHPRPDPQPPDAPPTAGKH
jgi:hypothetical protein